MVQEKTSNQETMKERYVLSLIDAIRNLQNSSKENINTDLNNQDKDLLPKLLAEALTEVISDHNPDNDRNTEIKNSNTSKVSNSGNSDVDIKIHIDLSSIAFAMLYSLYANKQLSSEELESAISRLEEYKTK